MDRLRNLLTRFRLNELIILIPLLVLVLGIWSFVELADEVSEGSTRRFDEWAVRALRSPGDPSDALGPGWLEEMGRDLTALGGVGVMLLTIAVVAGFLFLEGRTRSAWLVIVASVGGLALSMTLKQFYHRERPDLVPHLSAVYTHSFPSGHSMLSAAVYLTLGTLLARTVKDRATRIYCVAAGALLAGLVGISRVYMGVHYPTDVLAGWAAGASWAVLCWLVAAYLQEHGAVEKPSETLETHGKSAGV